MTLQMNIPLRSAPVFNVVGPSQSRMARGVGLDGAALGPRRGIQPRAPAALPAAVSTDVLCHN